MTDTNKATIWRCSFNHAPRLNLGNGKREYVNAVYVTVEPNRVNRYTHAARVAEETVRRLFLRSNRRMAKNAAYVQRVVQVTEIPRDEKYVKALTDSDVVRALYLHQLDLCRGDQEWAWKSALRDQREI